MIENCILKLKPHMMQAVRYMGFPLDNYSEIVTSICQNHSDAVKHGGIGVSSDNATHVCIKFLSFYSLYSLLLCI